MRLPRYRTGDAELDADIAKLVDRTADPANADLVFELVASAMRLAADRADRGDLKLANASLQEMRHAFHVFAPYRAAQSSRSSAPPARSPTTRSTSRRAISRPRSPRRLDGRHRRGPRDHGGRARGRGPENAFGVAIKLPFEAATSQFIDGDPKLVNFRYFFTRKLEFIKESDAFVLLPGGFGTLDEAFELLTLLQTGKAQPAPVVLLDVPGGTYWQSWSDFVTRELHDAEYISADDMCLVRITDNIEETVDEVFGFYTNYHSLRFVNGVLVLRMHRAPTPDDLAGIAVDFADIIVRGEYEVIDATPAEIADADHVDLARLAFRFDRRSWSRLRELIDRLNGRTDPVA